MTRAAAGQFETAAVLHVLSAGAAKGLVLALQDRYADRSGMRIDGTFGAVGAIRERWAAGAACDVIVLTAAMLDEMAAAGGIVPDTRAPIGNVRTGIAVRSGDTKPAIATSDALRAALVAAPALYCPDTVRSTAGIHVLRVLDRLGLRDTLRARLHEYPNGAIAMAQLAAEGPRGAIGCTQVTEILYTPGVDFAGMLPPEFELATVYAAAVSARAADPSRARQLIDLLTGPESEALRCSSGFEPVART